MNTPADKPDLPSFEVSFSIEPNRKWSDFDVAKYASQASDEREAWARADERRKAGGSYSLLQCYRGQRKQVLQTHR